MQITLQTFGWRLTVDRVERPIRELPPHREKAAEYPETRAAKLCHQETLQRLRAIRQEASLRNGRIF